MRYLPGMSEAVCRRTFLALALSGVALPARAQDASASAWGNAHSARMRLLAGELLADGGYRAAVEIRLDAGFKTYWRHPGDAGLPPVLDWSASGNVADVTVHWPAPVRFPDPAGFSNGYPDGVVLPVTVKPLEAGKPVVLALTLDFGVCKDICIPARSQAELPLPREGSGRYARVIASALAREPRRVAFGEGTPGIAAIRALPGVGRRGALSVTLRTPAGSTPELFVEAPEPWLFGTPKAVEASGEERVYHVPVEFGPEPGSAGASGSLALRLTLVLPDRAIESEATLDAGSFRS